MSIKCSVYIASSVDGFIAAADGGIEWLHQPEYAISSLNGVSFETFISAVDALVVGRNTFEKVLSFPNWPYNNIPVITLTSRELTIPDYLQDKVRVMSGAPDEIVEVLGAEGYEHLYIDGGETIQRFIRAGLVDEMIITRIPILLGDGIPLFGSMDSKVSLRLMAVATSDNGFVQVKYAIEKSRDASA